MATTTTARALSAANINDNTTRDITAADLRAVVAAVLDAVDNVEAQTVTVKQFGAAGNGVTNDTAAFQAAINASKDVYVPPGTYVISSLSIGNAAFRLMGAGRGITTLKLITPADQNAITITAPVGFPNPRDGIWGALIENMTIDGSSATAMNQPAINIIGGHGAVCRNLIFTKCASGIRLKDCHMSAVVDTAYFDLKAVTGIGVLVEGYGDQFIDRIYVDTTVPIGYSGEPAAGVKCTSSGNICVLSGDILHCRVGIDLAPEAGQLVEWFLLGPVYVDQSSDIGIRVLPVGGGVVRGGLMHGTWASTANTGILIGADGGSTISGITLNGVRVYNAYGNGIDIQAGTGYQISGGSRIGGNGRKISGTCNTSGVNVTLTGSAEANTVLANRQCQINGVTYTVATIVTNKSITLTTSAGVQNNVSFTVGANSSAAGINIGAGVSAVTVTGNILGGIDTLVNDQAWGVAVGTGVTPVIITDNAFRSNSVAPIAFSASADAEQVIANNAGIDDVVAVVASAATLTLPINPMVKVTGTTAVTAIAGPRWRGRRVSLITVSGAVAFSAGATIAAAYTSTANRPFDAWCDGSMWYIG